MSSFKDANGRQWLLDLAIHDLRRVKSILKLDLLDLDKGGALHQLANDPVLLVDLLWVLCEEQAEKHNLTDEQFGCGFRGEAIEEATEALFEALIDFFPPQRRVLLQRVLTTAKILGQKQTDLVEMTLSSEALDQFMEKELAELKAKLEKSLAGGNTSTSSPESAESTPEPSPSVA
jgi:hypothetical protein